MASILLIDDSVSALASVEAMLTEAGHEVFAFSCSRSALELLRHDPVDLIITDIYMPDADGLEVIRDTRRICPKTPVIAISGAIGTMSMLRLASMLGAAAALQKPFSNTDLLNAVQLAVGAKN